jgi:sugar (pentulose or hexulose) kinase
MSFEIRRCLDAFGQKSIASVRVTGWITQSSSDLQLLADILGRPVEGWRLESASAIGAALLTGLADQNKYFMNARTVGLEPSRNSRRYQDLYAKYIAEIPTASEGV